MKATEVLKLYELGLTAIRADYPNAARKYKLSTFVLGATDVCSAAMQLIPDTDASFRDIKRPFAQAIDQIRLKLFGVSEGFNPVEMPADEYAALLDKLDKVNIDI